MCFLDNDVRPDNCGDLALSPPKHMLLSSRQFSKKPHYTNGPGKKMLDLI